MDIEYARREFVDDDVPFPAFFIASVLALISSRNGFAMIPALTLIPLVASATIRGFEDASSAVMGIPRS